MQTGSDPAAAPRAMAETRLVDVGGHRLRVRSLGRGSRCYVFLHGLLDTLEIWRRVEEKLTARGRLVLVDQRAHGESDAPPGPYRREELAADVIGLLDALEIERAVLVGHSMGGIVAMTTALSAPERVEALALLGTASQCSERVAGWYDEIAQAGETEGLPGLARKVFGSDSSRQVRGDAAGIAHLTRTLRSLWDDPLTPKLARIECPVVLVVGEKDPMGPKAWTLIADALPDSTLRVLPGVGHWSHVESPDEVVEALGTLTTRMAT